MKMMKLRYPCVSIASILWRHHHHHHVVVVVVQSVVVVVMVVVSAVTVDESIVDPYWVMNLNGDDDSEHHVNGDIRYCVGDDHDDCCVGWDPYCCLVVDRILARSPHLW